MNKRCRLVYSQNAPYSKWVSVEFTDDGEYWKQDCGGRVVKGEDHNWNDDELPNEYIHTFILDRLKTLINNGYKWE